MSKMDSISSALNKIDKMILQKTLVIDSLELLSEEMGDSEGSWKEMNAMRTLLERDIEFLKEIKLDSLRRRIPVIMLTTSKEESDRIESFDLGISGYMTKPVDYTQFIEVVRSIDMYWSLSEFA